MTISTGRLSEGQAHPRGSLFKRGYVPVAPMRDENLSEAKAEESEIEGRHENSGQKDHKGAR